MKHLIDPGPIDAVNLDGTPAYDPVKGIDGYPVIETVEGQRRVKMHRVVLTMSETLLNLMSVPAFVGEKKGMDAAVFILEARQAIKAWSPGPGPKTLENEYHAGFMRVLKEHDFGASHGHNFVPYMRAIADAKDAPAAVAALPAPAAVAALPAPESAPS